MQPRNLARCLISSFCLAAGTSGCTQTQPAASAEPAATTSAVEPDTLGPAGSLRSRFAGVLPRG